MAIESDFDSLFVKLTGMPATLSWQERLFRRFCSDDIPNTIDMPTGLGKTMVMAIWLLARVKHPEKMPTRLIYVVDRRTVVDQATDLATKFVKNWRKLEIDGEPPAISTLRGQRADNREWSRNPSRPAIIIGTVDLIGSALLFSGYRSSFKRRPLEAGLLGQDSLLVLDEAHLSKPFEKLICAIEQFNKNGGSDALSVRPMHVICMSATSDEKDKDKSEVFALDTDENSEYFDLWSETDEYGNEKNPIKTRFEAKKCLSIEPLGEKDDLKKKIAAAAVQLAQDPNTAGKRIAIFVKKPDDAKAIAKRIEESSTEYIDESGAKPKKVKITPYTGSVQVLTGTMRGLERDELVEKSVFTERWLNGNLKPHDPANQQPVFLVSTSAGEVGFDLNADHLVGDAAPLDSWIQRLGRVNRRGNGDATVILIRDSQPADKTDFDRACTAASKLLTDGMDVSPQALVAFKKSLTPEQVHEASSPTPAMMELTDILLDAWSMTSITEPMPGRPEVGSWLRGIADELPQTTIAWRAELDLPGFDQLDLDSIEEWFDTHCILTHETLSIPTSSKSEGSAEKWLIARWDQLGKTLGEEEQRRIGTRPIIIDQSGVKVVPLRDLVDELKRGNTSSIRYAELILPASFGGIEQQIGLLDVSAPTKPVDDKNADEQTQQANAKARLIAPDVADVRGRYREKVEKLEDGDKFETRIGSGSKPTNRKSHLRYVIELESNDDKRVQLVSYIPRREKPEFGSGNPETLVCHVCKVRGALNAIIKQITQSNKDLLTDAMIQASQLAADYHDHGKNREFFERTVGGTATLGNTDWLNQKSLEGDGRHQCLGKSGGQNFGKAPRGYRHEFGSLREFTDDFNSGKLHDDSGHPISQDVFDLAAHLIATHHGRGRPHFAHGGFDPECESRSDEIHTESIRRFARLQKKYGWWRLAWLENLLRCADALASSDQDAANDPDGTTGKEGDAQ